MFLFLFASPLLYFWLPTYLNRAYYLNWLKLKKVVMMDTSNKEIEGILKKANKNPWMLTSAILGIALLISLIFLFSEGETGKAIPKEKAGEAITNYLNSQTGGGVKYVSSSDKGNLYEVIVSYQGKNIPVQITKDGVYFVRGITPITGNLETDQNAPQQPATKTTIKSDKPIVEAFIFSYCPYGLQFEKALSPVYDLLKENVEFNIVAIGAMHGEFERVESLRQISIEQLYGKEKLFLYLKEFNGNSEIGNCMGNDVCLNQYLPIIHNKLGLDKQKVEEHMKNYAGKIYDEQVSKAGSLGIGGSPTFVINGAIVDVTRNSNAIKEVICNAFNNAPKECSTALSSAPVSAGFGSGGSGSSSAAQC